MNYPSINEYKEAILFAEDNFEQLKNLRPVLGEDGEPVMTSGNFAVVFKMKDEKTGKLHAVKCFLREQEGRAEAYCMIAEELEYVSSTFLTPIKYLDKELFVDTNAGDDTEFPVLLMDWVEGDTLDKYIRKHLDDQYELSLLAYQFSRLAMWLMPQPFAHGDLKPDNILVKSDGTLVLVDYDGMYVPAMKGQKARELGSPDFRHPGRTEEVFDDHIDDFSLASILLSLKAISLQPSLLEEYGASDRLLFSEKDFRNLSESKVMDALKLLMQDTELTSLYSLFILAISQNNLSQVSFRLFNLSRPERAQYEEEFFSTEVTEEDLANAWTDEFGVKYSKDRRRLLKAPQGIKEYNVRKGTLVICDEAFSEALGYTSLQSIIIPDSIVKIGNRTFWDCEQLSNIKLSRSLSYIGEKAFSGCKKLYEIDLPNSVLSIGDRAFYGCESLAVVNIPNSLTSIESKVFSECAFSNISIPSSVKAIGSYAFSRCEYLAEIDIPDSVVKIGSGAFSGCGSLEQITLPKRIEEIEDEVFRGCALTKISIPTSVTKIGNRAFWDCSISDISIPNSVTTIEEGAFYGCPLQQIVIPSSITKIEDETFCECFALKQVIIPNSVYEIGNDAFYNCTSLTTIKLPNSINELGDNSFSGCESLEAITIPEKVKSIGDFAFSRCVWLEEVTFLGNIPELGTSVFAGCDNLLYINVPVGVKKNLGEFFSSYTIRETGEDVLSIMASDKNLIKAWIDDFGVKYSQDRKRLLKAPKDITHYSIIKGTEVICNNAFGECEKMTSIEVPNSVIAIGEYAFSGCNGLLSIEIPSSVSYIGEYAFYWCAKLQKVYIQSQLKSIEACVFKFCPNLSLITLPANIESIGYGAFWGCKSITTITIPEKVSYISEMAFAHCEELSSIRIESRILKLGPEVFYCSKKLSTVIIPKGTKKNYKEMLHDYTGKLVEQNGEENFCTEVTDDDWENAWTDKYGAKYSLDRKKILAVPNNIKDYTIKYGTLVICDYAFCIKDEDVISGGSIVKVEIPDTVLKIGNCAFTLCSSLKQITIPSSVLEIGNGAFDSCGALSDVVIPDSVMKIGNSAFAHCHGLRTITIPKSVTYIGMNPFRGCEKLETIICKSDTYIYEEGALFSKDMSVLISYFYKGTSYSVPNGVVLIGKSAFSCFRRLTEVIIPDSVKEIGDWAFSGCTSLKYISIPPTITNIGCQAFFNCKSLTQIKIPESILQIGNDVFGACCSLKKIIVPKGYIKKYERLLSKWCWHLLVEE